MEYIWVRTFCMLIKDGCCLLKGNWFHLMGELASIVWENFHTMGDCHTMGDDYNWNPKFSTVVGLPNPKMNSVVRLPNPKLSTVVWLPNPKFKTMGAGDTFLRIQNLFLVSIHTGMSELYLQWDFDDRNRFMYCQFLVNTYYWLYDKWF